MMQELLMLGGSLVGVGLVVLLVHLLGQGKGSIDSDEQAADLAEALAPGFQAGTVLRDKDGRAALVADAAGNGFVLMKQAGSHASGRFLAAPRVVQSDGELAIDSEDRWFGRVRIAPGNNSASNSMQALLRQRGTV